MSCPVEIFHQRTIGRMLGLAVVGRTPSFTLSIFILIIGKIQRSFISIIHIISNTNTFSFDSCFSGDHDNAIFCTGTIKAAAGAPFRMVMLSISSGLMLDKPSPPSEVFPPHHRLLHQWNYRYLVPIPTGLVPKLVLSIGHH